MVKRRKNSWQRCNNDVVDRYSLTCLSYRRYVSLSKTLRREYRSNGIRFQLEFRSCGNR